MAGSSCPAGAGWGCRAAGASMGGTSRSQRCREVEALGERKRDNRNLTPEISTESQLEH